MVVWLDPAYLAVSALVRAKTQTPKQRRRCRATLVETMDDLAAPTKIEAEARRLVRDACWSCGRCAGI